MVLELMADGAARSRSQIHDVVGPRLRLSAEEASATLESGAFVWKNRLDWAVSDLKLAQLLKYPKRGLSVITKAGMEMAARDLSASEIQKEVNALMAEGRRRAKSSEPDDADDDERPSEEPKPTLEGISEQVFCFNWK